MPAEPSPPDKKQPDHPIFTAVQPSGGFIDRIVERKVAEGRARGLFDDLPGHGKPLPDLDHPQRAGSWAERFVRRERHTTKREELVASIRASMAPLWRLPNETAVRTRIAEINADVAEYNRVTTVEPVEPLSVDDTLATWNRLNARA